MAETEIELEIGAAGLQGEYVVRVIHAAGGGAPQGRLCLDVDGMIARRGRLEDSVLASGALARRGVSSAEQPLRQIGQELFTALFDGQVGSVYRASLAVAGDRDTKLRVVLRLTAPELSVLPWEALYDPELEAYLCRMEPLVRHIAAPCTPEPLPVKLPLRVLGLIASPRGLGLLDVDAEQHQLERALAAPIAAGRVDLQWLAHASWDGVHERLLNGRWHVLHFIGHGDYDPDADEGQLALLDEDDRPYWVRASSLADLLRQAEPTPRLVLLNSCSSGQGGERDLFSSTAATLVRSGIAAVAAMQFSVTDRAAIAFPRGFYGALAAGRTVDNAVRAGRIAILGDSEHTLEWVTPVLYLRDKASQLFTPTTTTEEPGEVPVPEGDQQGSIGALGTYLDALRTDLSLWRGLGLGRSVRLTDTYVSVDVGVDRPMPETDILTKLLEGPPPERTVVIEGPPGCGKTTLLRHWALACAAPESRAVPVFLPLASVEADLGGRWDADVVQLVADQFRPTSLTSNTSLESALESAAAAGRLLVLLDGADEVTQEARPMLIRWLRKQRRRLGSSPLAISSRPVGVLDATIARAYRVRPFGEAQQRAFVHNWFQSASEATEEVPDQPAREATRQVLKLITSRPRIRPAVTNPLFLLMVCIDYEVSGHIPNSPATLLDRFVHILLDEWDRERGVIRTLGGQTFPTVTRMRVIEAVASHSFEWDRRRFPRSQAVEIASEIVDDVVQAQLVINEIEAASGLLVTNRRGECQFAHPLLQEFFVARHRASSALAGDSQDDWFARRLYDDRFANVVQYYDELIESERGPR